jgi:prepilin-type N-terminal cleavage/methylation domain-containing protein
MSHKNCQIGGFTLWEILIVVVVVGAIAYIASIALRPNYFRDGHGSTINACVNNLRIIDGAKGQWAIENHKQLLDIPVGSDIQPYMGRGLRGALPVCPNDPKQTFETSYSPNNVRTVPTCKILPTNHILR